MNGFINVNKAQSVSSAREVAIIKRLTHTRCGHMGTLDPMARGVLPVAVGNACRLFDFFLAKKKTYTATFAFGSHYDTLDTTGKILAEGGPVPSAGRIREVIPCFIGEIMQVPPDYSAKNVNGRRGYELARQGVDFTLPPKKVIIYSIELLRQSGESSFDFSITCGGGTYIRSIARDMAAKLDTYAAMSALTRTASGPFPIENSVCTDDLSEENISGYLIPAQDVLDLPSYRAEGEEAKRLFNGLASESGLADGLYKIFRGDEFYGIAAAERGYIKVRTKLC